MCICMYVAYILHICIPVEVYSFHPHTNRVYVHIYTGNGMHTHEPYVHRCGPTFRTFMFKPDISILNRFFFPVRAAKHFAQRTKRSVISVGCFFQPYSTCVRQTFKCLSIEEGVRHSKSAQISDCVMQLYLFEGTRYFLPVVWQQTRHTLASKFHPSRQQRPT